jgi:hypothetical protein
VNNPSLKENNDSKQILLSTRRTDNLSEEVYIKGNVYFSNQNNNHPPHHYATCTVHLIFLGLFIV